MTLTDPSSIDNNWGMQTSKTITVLGPKGHMFEVLHEYWSSVQPHFTLSSTQVPIPVLEEARMTSSVGMSRVNWIPLVSS